MSDICSQLLILGQGLKIYFLWDEQLCFFICQKKNILFFYKNLINFNKVNYFELILIKKKFHNSSVVNFEPVDRLVWKKIINEKSRDIFFFFSYFEFINHFKLFNGIMDGQTLCLLALNSFPRNWNVKYLVFKIGRLQNLSFHCIFFKTALNFFLSFIAIESYVVGIPITGNFVKIQCLSKNLKKNQVTCLPLVTKIATSE